MKLNPIASNMNELHLNDSTRVLFSYSTPVASLSGDKVLLTEKKWSQTTTRHINKWLATLSYTKLNVEPQSFFDNLVQGA